MNDKNSKIAFDIGELPENIDLDSPPVTGFDYLYRVRLESRKCPKVVVSNIDTAQFVRHQTVSVDFCNGFIRALPGFEPNQKWQKEQLILFTDTRNKLFTHRTYLKTKFHKREYPNFDSQSWCIYTLGKEKCHLIYNVKGNEEEGNSSPVPKKQRVTDMGNPPLLSIILYMAQHNVIRLILYHIDWLERHPVFSHEQGEWLYALLLCLEKPLDPDTCSLLRRLSRICSTLRSKLSDPHDEFLNPLNLLITIISDYFDQKDMSDNFLNE